MSDIAHSHARTHTRTHVHTVATLLHHRIYRLAHLKSLLHESNIKFNFNTSQANINKIKRTHSTLKYKHIWSCAQIYMRPG